MTARTLDLHLLERVVARHELVGHDGRSGAVIERVTLDDGRRLVVKTVHPEIDLVMHMTGDTAGRELELFAEGVFDRLPDGVACPVVGGGRRGEALVTVMEDLGDAVCGWERNLSRDEARRIFAAAGAVHETFLGSVPSGLCDLRHRLSMFGPRRMRPFVADSNPLPALVCRGWEIFAELVPGVGDGRGVRALRASGPVGGRDERGAHDLASR